MDTREVTTLPLAQSLISSLIENGFFYAKSLVGLRALELCKELQISVEEAQTIIQCLDQTTTDLKMHSAKVIISQIQI